MLIRVFFTILNRIMWWPSKCSNTHPLYSVKNECQKKSMWAVLLGPCEAEAEWGIAVWLMLLSDEPEKPTFHCPECCKDCDFQLLLRSASCTRQDRSQGHRALRQLEVRGHRELCHSHTLKLTDPHFKHHKWLAFLPSVFNFQEEIKWQ